MVMVGKECHHVAEVRISKILREDAIDAGHTLGPIYILLAHRSYHCVPQGEVHY